MNGLFPPTPGRLGAASDASDDDVLDVPGNAPPQAKNLRECQRRVLSAIMEGKVSATPPPTVRSRENRLQLGEE